MTEGSPGGIIGRNLRAVREAQLLSRAGVSVPGIDHLERGLTSRPRRSTIEKLAAALDVPVEQLMSEDAASPKVSAPPSLFDGLEEERRIAESEKWLRYARSQADRWEQRLLRAELG